MSPQSHLEGNSQQDKIKTIKKERDKIDTMKILTFLDIKNNESIAFNLMKLLIWGSQFPGSCDRHYQSQEYSGMQKKQCNYDMLEYEPNAFKQLLWGS